MALEYSEYAWPGKPGLKSGTGSGQRPDPEKTLALAGGRVRGGLPGRFCQNRRRVPGLSFRQGDARKLPLEDGLVDAVIDVEASHCYPAFWPSWRGCWGPATTSSRRISALPR